MSDNVFSADIGFGYVKAIYNSPKNRILFPSVVKKVNTFENILIGSPENYQVEYTDKEGTVNAYIGTAGLTHRGTRRWEDKDALDIESLKLLVATAAASLDVAPDSTICVGLPLSFYNNVEVREQLREIFRNFKATVKIGKKEREIRFSDVKVHAQGAGAYFSSLFNFSGSPKNPKLMNEAIAFFDIGFRTFDYLYITQGEKGHTSLPEFSGSLEEFGMNKALQIAAKNVNSKHNADVTVNEVEKALFWESYNGRLKNPNVEIKPFYEAAKKELVKEIGNTLRQKWQDATKDLTAIIVTGGGGEELFNFFKEQFATEMILQEDASFANAIGYATKLNLQKALKKGA